MPAAENRGPSRRSRRKRPARRAPLGLPAGSVRALLTLLIVAVVVVQTLRGQEVAILWVEALMIALAHYFTSRRFIELRPDVLRRLEDEGHLAAEANPLYLPRHSIRFMILAAFIGTGVYLHQQGRLWEPQAVGILGTVAAYFLGIVLGELRRWCWKGHPAAGQAGWWDDLKAAVVILALGATAALHLADQAPMLPAVAQNIALALALFYFGSR